MHSSSLHPHLRKRIYKNLEPFPHPNPAKRFLDKIIFVIGALGPAATIPQIYSIYAAKDATGVSILTWGGYCLFSLIWVIYGIVHKEKAIIFAHTLWFTVNALVAIGVLLY